MVKKAWVQKFKSAWVMGPWARMFSSLDLIHKMKDFNKMIPKDMSSFKITQFYELPTGGKRSQVTRSSEEPWKWEKQEHSSMFLFNSRDGNNSSWSTEVQQIMPPYIELFTLSTWMFNTPKTLNGNSPGNE